MIAILIITLHGYHSDRRTHIEDTDLQGSGSDNMLRYYPTIHLEGLTKTTNNFIQDGRSPGRDLNLGPLKYEAASANHQITKFGY
jgi:hypothetical protein